MDNKDSKARQESSNERARKDMAEFKARQAKLNERVLVDKNREKTTIKSGMTEVKPRESKNNKEQNIIKTQRIKSDKDKEEKLKINRARKEVVREEKKKIQDTDNMSKADKQAKVEERAKKRLENMAKIDERARKEAEKKLVKSIKEDTKDYNNKKSPIKMTKQSQGDTSLGKRVQSTKQVTEEKATRGNKEHSKVTDIKEVQKAALENEKKRRKEAREAHIRHRIEQLKTTKAKVIIACFVFIVAFLIFVSMTIINEIEIDEGKHYTEEQIKRLVIKNVFEYNSVYLFLKYRYSEHEAIPFVEYIDVSWVNKNAVKIKVYDKNIIGCTNFMNEYVYFDKDGLVVETSTKREKDIPYITGIEFEELTLNSKIKVADEEIFEVILTVTQQISKYELDIQEMNFDKDYNLTLQSGDIKVLLGKQLTYDEQLAKLQSMLREAKKEKLSGVLHMEKYKEGQDRIIFDKNN